MKKVLIIILIAIILSLIFFPKFIKEGDGKVKFETLGKNEIPQKITDILPSYLANERALGCKIGDEVYIIVTRGEKKTEGYSVTIDRIEKDTNGKDEYGLTIYALFKDPKPDDIVAQKISYPFTIVKTNLDILPSTIELEVLYEE